MNNKFPALLGRGKNPAGIGAPVKPSILIEMDMATGEISMQCNAAILLGMHMTHAAHGNLLMKYNDVLRLEAQQLEAQAQQMKDDEMQDQREAGEIESSPASMRIN